MENLVSFGEVLEAADKLSLEEQEELEDVLHRRIIERRREEIIEEIQNAERESQEGRCRPATVDELMTEIAEGEKRYPSKAKDEP